MLGSQSANAVSQSCLSEPSPLPASRPIVCFAKDWSEQPTSNNHVMVELAKSHPVLWLNSVATRAPKLSSGRDISKILKKIVACVRGPQKVEGNLWVYTPIVLPLPHSRWATSINRKVLQLMLRHLCRRLGFKDFELWSFLPNVGEYVDRMGAAVIVYYCVDEWSKFRYLDGSRIADAEQAMCRKADVVFASANSLVEPRRRWNSETHLALHGVDHAQFAKALLDATPVPRDIASIQRPIIGFYGTLQDWVDLELIAFLAERHPEWSIVLIGNQMTDLSRLNRSSNVHVLGRRPHAELPGYCKAFSVGIIPYVVNERILHVNPLKLREYLCAGLPVVSVAIPEVETYPQCAVARTYEQFESAIERALQSDSAELRRQRSDGMLSETWQHRVAELRTHILRVTRRKCRGR